MDSFQGREKDLILLTCVRYKNFFRFANAGSPTTLPATGWVGRFHTFSSVNHMLVTLLLFLFSGEEAVPPPVTCRHNQHETTFFWFEPRINWK